MTTHRSPQLPSKALRFSFVMIICLSISSYLFLNSLPDNMPGQQVHKVEELDRSRVVGEIPLPDIQWAEHVLSFVKKAILMDLN